MSDDIDFSDEGLASYVEGAEAPSDVATEGPEPEAPAEDLPVQEEAADEAPESADSPEDLPEREEVAETPNEWQVRYDEAQKLIGRQGQELGELRKMMEQIQQAQAPAQDDAPALHGWQPTTQDELLEGAADPNFAVDAYTFARDQAPELLPDVLAEVRYHDPALAERMQLDYISSMMQAQVAPVQETLARNATQQQAAAVVENYGATVEGWDSMREEVAGIIEEEPWLVGDGTPEAVERGLRAATRMAQQARDHAAAQVRAQQQAQGITQRQQAAVETGTPSAAPQVEDVSQAESIANAIFEQDQIRRELF